MVTMAAISFQGHGRRTRSVQLTGFEAVDVLFLQGERSMEQAACMLELLHVDNKTLGGPG